MSSDKLERINIGGNIFINFVESDKFKSNYVVVDIISRLENGLKAAKSALLAKVLMQGSTKYPTMAEINKRTSYLYAAKIGVWAYKLGEAQVMSLSAEMLENKYSLDETNILDETIDVLADIFMNPLIKDGAFNKDYLETEKTNLINEIHAQINNKNSYVYRKCMQAMCKGERFAVNGTGEIEDVRQVDGASLYEHYNYLLENCAIEIFCVGRLAEKKQFITDKFKNLLQDIKRAENVEDYSSEVILKAENKGEIIEEMEVSQGKLAVGFRTGFSNKDKDYPSFILFNAIYGASPTSKLFENVREKLSLCYYCHTSVEAEKGIVTILSGVEVENKQKAIDEILKQLEEVKAGNFTEKEIEDSRRSVINSYKGVYDNFGGISFWYLRQLMKGDVKTPDEAIDAINKVGREDVINAANKLTLDTIYFLQGTSSGNPEDLNDLDDSEDLESEDE
jgi:predicted Zn-dependent peptidase